MIIKWIGNAGILFLIIAAGCVRQARVTTDDIQDAMTFSEGLAGYEIKGKWGFADRHGRVAVPPQFALVSPFSQGLAAVKLVAMWGYISRSGRMEINPRFDEARDFSEDLAAVRVKGSWGFINRRGDFAIAPQFEGARSFSEGRAAVMIGGRWGFIQKKGKIEINPTYRDTGDFCAGLAPVRTDKSDDAWGYINQRNAMIIQPQFDGAGNFDRDTGLAPVKIDTLWGYIGKNGKNVINPQFQAADPFYRGRAAVKKDGLWGYLDHKGGFAVQNRFSFADDFHDDLVLVVEDGRGGFIDRDGKRTGALRDLRTAVRNTNDPVRPKGPTTSGPSGIDEIKLNILMAGVLRHQGKADQAREYLRKAVNLLDDEIGKSHGRRAYLFKAQVLCGLGDFDGAMAVTDEYAGRHPNTGEESMMRALVTAARKGPGATVNGHLTEALSRGVAAMNDRDFWFFVEKSGVFDTYVKSGDLRVLISLKGKTLLPEGRKKQPRSGGSDHGESKWDSSIWFLYLFVGEDYMWILETVLELTEHMVHFIGFMSEILEPICYVMAAIIVLQNARVKAENRGCGVKLTWTWAQIIFGGPVGLTGFWVNPQEDCGSAKKCYPPDHLKINIDTSKPVPASATAKLTASKVDFPAQYRFRFEFEGHAPRETEWLGSNEFEYPVQKFMKGDNVKTTVFVMARNSRTGQVSADGPEKITYVTVKDPDPYIEKITGFDYDPRDDEIPCNLDDTVTIRARGGRCSSGEGELWMFQPFLNNVQKGSNFPREGNTVKWNPKSNCGTAGLRYKPGDKLKFRVYARCRNHEQFSTDGVFTKEFTISENQGN